MQYDDVRDFYLKGLSNGEWSMVNGQWSISNKRKV